MPEKKHQHLFKKLFRKVGKPTEEEKQNMLWEIVQQTSHKMTRRIGSHELTLDENYKITNNRDKTKHFGVL